MTIYDARQRHRQRQGDLPADRVVCADSLDRALIEVAAPGWDGDGRWWVPVLGRRGELPADLRRQVLANDAGAEAVPAESVGEIDAEAVADWITGLYRDRTCPAVVLGSPHGGAVHLAAALGVAWLPTSFPVTLRWPGGSAGDWAAAMSWGATLAGKIMAGNPSVSVRQVHDPVVRGPLCGATVTLRLRWRTLPAAYLEFLRSRLPPGGSSLLLRDMRTWPVLDAGPGFGFQIGSPTTGWSHADYHPDLAPFRRLLDSLGVQEWSRPYQDAPVRYAETAGDPAIGPRLRDVAAETGQAAYRVLYSSPELLSACLADLLRDHLGGVAGCVVETGRLLDPRGVLTRRLVPYWCESASLRAVAGAEWWLAGSEHFDDVTVVPGPPGTECEAHAGLVHWRSLAGFATRTGRVDRLAAGRYPRLPLSTRHASRVVSEAAEPRPEPPHLTMRQAIDTLRANAPALGLLVG